MIKKGQRTLVDYFKKNLEKGYNEETLKWALINQGYSRVEVQRSLELAHEEIAQAKPKEKEKPKIRYEVLDENNKTLHLEDIEPEEKKPFWKRWFG